MKSKYISYIFLVLLLFTFVCSSEIFTAEKMHSLHRLSSFITSLDGKYIVYVNRIWKKEDNKYYTNLECLEVAQYQKKINGEENAAVPIIITPSTSEHTDSDPVFSDQFPNYLFFLRSGSEGSSVYYIAFPPQAGAEPAKLTNYVISIANLKLQKNTLVFSAEVYFVCQNFQCTKEKDDEVASRGSNTYSIYTKLMMRHWDFWYQEGKDAHPFYQKLAKNPDGTPRLEGDPVDMMQDQVFCSPPLENGAEQFSISPDGNLVAFSAHNKDEKMSYNTKWDIYLYNIETKERKELTASEGGRCQSPIFNPNNNDQLAYLCMLHYGLESDQLSLRIYSPSDGQVLNETNKTPFMISSYIWDPNHENTFILNTVNEGRVTLFSFDFSKRDQDFSLCYKNITVDNNAYGDPIYIYNDGNNMIISYSSFTRATLLGLLTLNPDTGIYASQVFYDANEVEMMQYEMVEPEWFTFTGANNDRIQGWIMKPINFVQGKKYPLAYLIHGGPEGAWEPAWSYRWNPNLWANHGFAVVMINPHGSSGMGIDFQNAVRYNWGGWPFEDIMKGWDYVTQNFDFIDETRVGGCGASYGGFMINWIQGHNDEKKFKCLVTHDGVFSTITMFYATEEMWFPMSEYCPHDEWGCKPYEEGYRKGFEDYNPEYFAQNWNTPHLIIHGSKDYRIPITEGISAFTTLQLRGIPSKFLHFPNENHWVLKPMNSIKWYYEVLGWLDKYLDNE